MAKLTLHLKISHEETAQIAKNTLFLCGVYSSNLALQVMRHAHFTSHAANQMSVSHDQWARVGSLDFILQLNIILGPRIAASSVSLCWSAGMVCLHCTNQSIMFKKQDVTCYYVENGKSFFL